MVDGSWADGLVRVVGTRGSKRRYLRVVLIFLFFVFLNYNGEFLVYIGSMKTVVVGNSR